MFQWVFDLPMLVSGPAIVAVLILFSLIGLRLTRRYLLSWMRIDPVIKDAACSILETWVGTDPASAASWVSGIPDGDFKSSASKIVFSHWSQSDPAGANTWAQKFPAD